MLNFVEPEKHVAIDFITHKLWWTTWSTTPWRCLWFSCPTRSTYAAWSLLHQHQFIKSILHISFLLPSIHQLNLNFNGKASALHSYRVHGVVFSMLCRSKHACLFGRIKTHQNTHLEGRSMNLCYTWRQKQQKCEDPQTWFGCSSNAIKEKTNKWKTYFCAL